MSRLPVVSGDNNAWGAILNNFLGVSLNADGTLKNAAAAVTAINVKDVAYGAVGDGLTNDTVAIQSALAVGGLIYFPTGTYLISTANLSLSTNTSLVIPQGTTLKFNGRRLTALNVNNISISGGGSLQFVNMNNTDAAPNGDWEVASRGAVEFGGTAASPSTNFTIIGMEVFSDFVGAPGGANNQRHRGIYLQCARQARVIGCRVRNFEGEAVCAGGVGTRDIVFSGNNVHDCNNDGLNFQGPAGINGGITGNTVFNCGSGIECSVGLIQGNTIDTMAGGGIFTGGGGGGPVTIRGNYIRNVGSQGISATFSVTTGPVEISGNTTNSSAAHGIQVATVTDLKCTDNLVVQAGTGGAAVQSIILTAVTRGFFDGNTILNPGANAVDGLSVGAGCTGLQIGVNGVAAHSSAAYAGFTNAGMFPSPQRVLSNMARVDNTGNVAENTVKTTTITGSFFGTTGGVRILAYGRVSGLNNTKTIRLKFGGTTISTVTEAAGEQDDWSIDAVVMNKQVTGTQSVRVLAFQGTTIEQHAYAEPAINTVGNVAIDLTAQVANAGDNIITDGFIVQPVIGNVLS